MGKNAAAAFNIPYLGSIPLDPAIVENGDDGSLVIEKDSIIDTSFRSIIKNIQQNFHEELINNDTEKGGRYYRN